MVTDRQVRKLRKLMKTEKTKAAAAAKAGMDEKTARKWRESSCMPSETQVERTWRTRPDPFAEVWDEMSAKLELNAGLEAQTLFEDLQRRYPGRFADGQLRTLQRRVKIWRATKGPSQEVFFAQCHEPGKRCQSDFTHMNDLGVTLAGRPFDHMMYHFVLPYSNWETVTICFSESMESLSEGLQNALWELGGVPGSHQTDRMSAAVHKPDNPEKFTQRYAALLRHYGIEGRRIQTGRPNENGDVEQRHYRFKRAADQALMLRGSRDFADRTAYNAFVRALIDQLNAGRKDRLREEVGRLHTLPQRRQEACKRIDVRVSGGSTIRVQNNTYSVHSRLIGERVQVRLFAEQVEVWYAQRRVEMMPRLRGAGKHHIAYRHVIDWLVRKPGAFENYRYREDLFPSHRFRMAWDDLSRRHAGGAAVRKYLALLELAAKENEAAAEAAIIDLMEDNRSPEPDDVKKRIEAGTTLSRPPEPVVARINLSDYDRALLGAGGVS